jgi:hypothetical protein
MLLGALREEHKPSGITETMLVDKMAQAFWLTRRAVVLQHTTFNHELPGCSAPKRLALYMRYETTHDRIFHKCLNELLKLRAEKWKQEIGFESQQQKKADQTRREAVENRKQELHRYAVLLAEAKADHQDLQNMNLRHSTAPVPSTETRAMEAQKAA